MTPDSLTREEALDPERSFIVEAPAGSGKTSLLVQRYLNLLSRVDRPEAVVAMTFTRKAAAEMRERVLSALEHTGPIDEVDEYRRRTYRLAQCVLANDERKGWNLRDDPSRLQIQTIDSLCALLTRQMPVVSHLGGSPKVRENVDDLLHVAARRTISGLTEGKENDRALFKRIALHFDNDLAALERQMVKMLGKREQWRTLRNHLHEAAVQDFCDLLGHAEGLLRDVFREAGEVDFTEITRAAIDALGGAESPSDLLYWLDYRIQHLLVDEFQDTSVAQYELIEALTGQWSEGDGRTLFVVGDPMQSIYRFREAEVAFFLNCWREERLGSVRLHRARLSSNFRSTPEIVQWTQDTFAPIMDQDDLEHGGVKLRSAHATRPETGVKPQLIPFVDDMGEQEARQVAELAQKSLATGDVAILVRARMHLASVLPALRAAGIRYEAFEIAQLCEEQHILDLISLTRAILHVGDRLSWLACLRAPWCGLSLAELAAIAEGELKKPILELLAQPHIASAVPRTAHVLEVMSQAVAAVGRLPLRDLVEGAWQGLGGPSALMEASLREDAETYFDLIEEFEKGGVIRDFSLLDERLQFLYARPAPGADCVKVMTIHGAKGLEFDTVIIPQLGRGASSSERDLLIWTEQVNEDGVATLLVAAQPQRKSEDLHYDRVKSELDVKEEHEFKRLFYVAVTRAKNRLYLLGNVKTKQNGADICEAPGGTFLKFLWPGVKPEFERERHRMQHRFTQLDLFAERKAKVNILKRLPEDYRVPRFDRSVRWEPELRRATASARKISYEWVSGTGRHVGTVVHEVIKHMAANASVWNEPRVAAMTPFFAQELERLGVGPAERDHAVGLVLRALTNTIASERGRWVIGAHTESKSEWAIGGRVGERLVSGTIDRTFRDAEGRRWIIDFKTSEHEGANLAGFLDKEQRRYRAQLESYAALLSHMTDDPIHLGLYFPLLDGWREWRFAEEVGAPASYTGQ